MDTNPLLLLLLIYECEHIDERYHTSSRRPRSP
jgi:hypothetical protein